MCISISIGHSGSGNNAIIYFNATDETGLNLYGDRAFGWGGYGTPTDEEYKASVTDYILGWFGKPETELCDYVPPSDNTLLYIAGAVFAVGLGIVFMKNK